MSLLLFLIVSIQSNYPIYLCRYHLLQRIQPTWNLLGSSFLLRVNVRKPLLLFITQPMRVPAPSLAADPDTRSWLPYLCTSSPTCTIYISRLLILVKESHCVQLYDWVEKKELLRNSNKDVIIMSRKINILKMHQVIDLCTQSATKRIQNSNFYKKTKHLNKVVLWTRSMICALWYVCLDRITKMYFKTNAMNNECIIQTVCVI